MSDEGENVAERLMGALISKMESMDENLQAIKAENKELRKMMNNPANMLKKAGFISSSTRRPQDVLEDSFRGEVGDTILKGADGEDLSVPRTNADFHKMEWADIHALAEEAKQAGNIGNNVGIE